MYISIFYHVSTCKESWWSLLVISYNSVVVISWFSKPFSNSQTKLMVVWVLSEIVNAWLILTMTVRSSVKPSSITISYSRSDRIKLIALSPTCLSYLVTFTAFEKQIKKLSVWYNKTRIFQKTFKIFIFLKT